MHRYVVYLAGFPFSSLSLNNIGHDGIKALSAAAEHLNFLEEI